MRSCYVGNVPNAAFTIYKLARARQLPGIREQKFQASRVMQVTHRLKVQSVEVSVTWIKLLRALPQEFPASQIASSTRGWSRQSKCSGYGSTGCHRYEVLDTQIPALEIDPNIQVYHNETVCFWTLYRH